MKVYFFCICVGDYKRRPNVVGGHETARPSDVPGRMAALLEDSKKMFYYRGLSEWEHEKGYLTDTCLDGQDTFKKLMAVFDIKT